MTHEQGGATVSDQTMVAIAEAFWQLPAILVSGWWNAAAAAWLPPAHGPCESAHGQLVVPEPLEETDERALFA